MNKKVIWLVIAIVIIIAVGFYVSNKETPENLSIKIGAVLSLSGPAVQDGENMQKGLELAKADLAKKGIIVDVLYQDDKTEPKDTISAINFLSTQGVQAIVGPTWSYLGDAGVPVADRLGIVLLQPANTSEYVSAKSPYSFFGVVRVEHIVPTLTEWLKDSGKKSIAVIRSQGAWYETVGKAVEAAAKEAGATIVVTESIPFGSEADAMPTIIAKLKNTKADLIFSEIDDEAGIVVMLKKMSEQGITAPIMSVTTAVGRVVNENKIPAGFQNEFFVAAPKSSKEFIDKFSATYNKTPGAYADRAYDALMVLVDAIQNKGDTPLQQYLKDTTDYEGYAGEYDFDANGDIVGGEWVIHSLK